MNYTSTILSQSSWPAATTEKLMTQKNQEQDNKAFVNSLCIQPKLTNEAAGDPLEKEADEMADTVMRMEMPRPINFSLAKDSVSRKCALPEKVLPVPQVPEEWSKYFFFTRHIQQGLKI